MTNAQTPLDQYAATPYLDQFEMRQDMSSSRYQESQAFRDIVAAKIALSTGIGTDSTHSITSPEFRSTSVSLDAITDGSVAEQQRAAQLADLEAFKSGHGPMAVQPPAAPKATPPRISPVHEGTETGPGF